MFFSSIRETGCILGRREFLAGSAIGLSACSSSQPRTRPRVSITRCPDYGSQMYAAVRAILASHRVDARGKRVVLKPNLVDFPRGRPVNTDARFVNAVLEAFRSLGASEVVIAEGSGHSRRTLEVAEETAFFTSVPGFERLFCDLNVDEPVRVVLPHPRSTLREIYVARTALTADLLVSLPKMKTHYWAGVTLGMKNLFGTVPGAVYGWPKNILHCSGIDECIADLNGIYRRMFTIVDGIIGMEGKGPLEGTAIRAGVIVAGHDTAAVDATCCRIMRIDPARIRALALAGSAGVLAGTGIEQIGDTIESVQREFALIPEHRGLRMGSKG